MRNYKMLLSLIGVFCIFTLTACDKMEDWFGGDDSKKDNINRGLVLHYNFDDATVNDLTANEYHGVAFNQPTYITDTPNQQGKALSLNGFKDQAVSIPYNPVADSSYFAVSFWLKDFTPGYIFTAMSANNNYDALSVKVVSDPRVFQVWTEERESETFSNYDYSGIQSGAWHHLVIEVSEISDERYLLLYVDGVLADRIQIWRSSSSALKFQIGNNAAETVSFKIDNFRLYNRSLTAKEVKMIYDAERK